MAFKPFSQVKKISPLGEPILCWLQAPADTGKTTLMLELLRALKEYGIGVVVPMDHRAEVYQKLADNEGIGVYPVSTDTTIWSNVEKIVKTLKVELPGSGAATIIWDSVSPGFTEVMTEAQRVAALTPEQRKQEIGNSNKTAAYQDKAQYMKQVATVANYGLNTIWISHEFSGRDAQAHEVTKTTITDTEIKKFRRNLNLQLRTNKENGRYFVEIVWARERPGLAGKKLYDEAGMFVGMWNRIFAEFTGAKVVAWEDVEFWAEPKEAWLAGFEQTLEAEGIMVTAFDDVKHAENAYNKLRETVMKVFTPEWVKANKDVPNAKAKHMAKTWKDDVQRRLLERWEIEATIQGKLQKAEMPKETPTEEVPEGEFAEMEQF
jgi:hypothetical protein